MVIPVRLYPAVRKRAVRFHELDEQGRRIRHVRVADPQPELDWEPGPEPGVRPYPALPAERVARSRSVAR